MDCSMPGFPSFTTSWSLLKLMSIESVMPSNHLILCHPHLLLPSIFPNIRGSSKELALHTSPFNEYSGLISLRMDWLDLLAVQGPLKSLLQHHSSKASILWCSVFFMVQLSSLPWLGSNDALPLATRMETRLPRRPTGGSLTSPSYLVRYWSHD